MRRTRRALRRVGFRERIRAARVTGPKPRYRRILFPFFPEGSTADWAFPIATLLQLRGASVLALALGDETNPKNGRDRSQLLKACSIDCVYEAQLISAQGRKAICKALQSVDDPRAFRWKGLPIGRSAQDGSAETLLRFARCVEAVDTLLCEGNVDKIVLPAEPRGLSVSVLRVARRYGVAVDIWRRKGSDRVWLEHDPLSDSPDSAGAWIPVPWRGGALDEAARLLPRANPQVDAIGSGVLHGAPFHTAGITGLGPKDLDSGPCGAFRDT